MKAIPAEHHRHLIRCIILLVGVMWGGASGLATSPQNKSDGESSKGILQFAASVPVPDQKNTVFVTYSTVASGDMSGNKDLFLAVSADHTLSIIEFVELFA